MVTVQQNSRKLESFLDLLCNTLHRNVDDHKSLLYYCNGFCGFDLIDGQANTETGPYRFNQLCVVYYPRRQSIHFVLKVSPTFWLLYHKTSNDIQNRVHGRWAASLTSWRIANLITLLASMTKIERRRMRRLLEPRMIWQPRDNVCIREAKRSQGPQFLDQWKQICF